MYTKDGFESNRELFSNQIILAGSPTSSVSDVNKYNKHSPHKPSNFMLDS